MDSDSHRESMAAGNAAAPGEAPRQIIQRPGGKDVELVTFPPGDREDPRNWPLWRKWSIVLAIMVIDLSVSWIASGFSPASMKFSKDLGVSEEVATLGLSLTVLGFALGPMTLAPLSEYYGRSLIYIVSYAIALLFILGTALVPNLGGFLTLRFLTGWFAAVTIANFGGTIADLFEPHATGIPMSIFLWAATVGSPSGYFIFSFVAQSRPWRHVFWALLGVCGGFWLVLIFTLRETRHSILLIRRAAKERKQTGNESLEVPDAMKQRGVKELFKVALVRPFRFLFTEAIIVFAALYNGYLYGLSFLFNDAFSLVFGPEGHGFKTSGVGLAFLGICVGISFGVVTNLWQERYYHKRIAKAGGKNVPEARVEIAKIAAITLPISLFWFAWTSYKTIHWIVPILASALWGWSFYALILMTYTYTEDSYKVEYPDISHTIRR
ncbi:major facilitator superfamily multidrug transporter mdrA [Physcia stellaris]|nr:major facilitator superfamily multidrug transporter mdrA [Physcia stellaris]